MRKKIQGKKGRCACGRKLVAVCPEVLESVGLMRKNVKRNTKNTVKG